MLVASGTKLMYEKLNYRTNRAFKPWVPKMCIKYCCSRIYRSELPILTEETTFQTRMVDIPMASKQQGRINPTPLILGDGSANFSVAEIY